MCTLIEPPPKVHPEPTMADLQAREGVKSLLAYVGEDPEREGLIETPARYTRFLREFTDAEPFNLTTFDAEGHDQMVVQTGIPFYSLCEHHLLPFFGTAAVAYVPDGRLIGLSKLARIVQHFARRPQNQERITQQTGRLLEEKLSPIGVGVVLTARHLCMEMRGVRVQEATTTTSYLSGLLKEDAKARAEFTALAFQQHR